MGDRDARRRQSADRLVDLPFLAFVEVPGFACRLAENNGRPASGFDRSPPAPGPPARAACRQSLPYPSWPRQPEVIFPCVSSCSRRVHVGDVLASSIWRLLWRRASILFSTTAMDDSFDYCRVFFLFENIAIHCCNGQCAIFLVVCRLLKTLALDLAQPTGGIRLCFWRCMHALSKWSP